jgi:transposase
VFDAQPFASAEQLSAYLGLAPCVRQSGQSKSRSRIMPSGQTFLRSMLVEACWILRSREKWAMDFYKRIHQRSGHFQQAITALARKLAILLWRLLLENRTYQNDYQTVKN